MAIRHLTLSWSVSRGRETYGYNICKLRDDDTGKTYKCLGGGYDMQGTVFGNWLEDQYQEELLKIAGETYYKTWPGTTLQVNESGLYGSCGYFYEGGTTTAARVGLDGACGLESIERIAKRIGLKVKHVTNRKGHVTAFLVATEGEEL